MPSTYAYARTRWRFAIFLAHRVLILESRWDGDCGQLYNAAQARHFSSVHMWKVRNGIKRSLLF
jgi:hypothetical protein